MSLPNYKKLKNLLLTHNSSAYFTMYAYEYMQYSAINLPTLWVIRPIFFRVLVFVKCAVSFCIFKWTVARESPENSESSENGKGASVISVLVKLHYNFIINGENMVCPFIGVVLEMYSWKRRRKNSFFSRCPHVWNFLGSNTLKYVFVFPWNPAIHKNCPNLRRPC